MTRANANVERTRSGSIGSRSLPLFFQTPILNVGHIHKNIFVPFPAIYPFYILSSYV